MSRGALSYVCLLLAVAVALWPVPHTWITFLVEFALVGALGALALHFKRRMI
jgi:hypothetical protein